MSEQFELVLLHAKCTGALRKPVQNLFVPFKYSSTTHCFVTINTCQHVITLMMIDISALLCSSITHFLARAIKDVTHEVPQYKHTLSDSDMPALPRTWRRPH
jgi:hypothetical protein